MRLTRRRFLSIAAAGAVASPAAAQSWQGRALGADVSITLHAAPAEAAAALAGARAMLREVERQFSLYLPGSALSRLNAQGVLRHPAPMFRQLLQAADRIHRATGGLFDPSVQPLWRALAEGRDPAPARALADWGRVRLGPEGVALGPGQALTLNGIAQGFATDLVTAVLRRAGLTRTLVDIGEFRAQGGPWKLGLSDPAQGYMGTRTITDGAIATSSPAATMLAGQGHILHPAAVPLWSTVSVSADDAATADGFSTALVLAPLGMIRSLPGRYGIRAITLVDMAGDLTTV